MYPILFNIEGYIFPSYGTAMVMAFLTCLFMILRNFPGELFSYRDLYNFCLIIFVAIFWGGRLLQFLLEGDLTLNNLTHLWHVLEVHNLATYPVLLATLILLYAYCLIRPLPYLATLDFLMPYAILALAIQRMFGCFLAGCCYGLPTDLPWGVHFPLTSSAGQAFPHFHLHPTQLYYSFSALAIWLFLLNLQKHKTRRQSGDITAMGLLLLSVSYFFITFWRGDVSPQFYYLIPSQVMAIVVFLGSIGLFVTNRFKRKLED
ncbi:MAG: hypothetical protein BWK78_00215 [Thiotrichaceae bacterium IS1]|nr:MAG: hypothetical protein BWK78_00215 [Thiotrichaceae bacterium IS1]